MNSSPHLEWLVRNWQLPASGSAAMAVVELLDAERNGSTAWELKANDLNWGGAAASSEDQRRLPLAIIAHNARHYLQSRHLFEAEQMVGQRLTAMATYPRLACIDRAKMSVLFPGAQPTDAQAAAARVANEHRLAIITGGPGTGKTYTLARILALLLESGIVPENIRLAASTGKAAERMKQAVSDSVGALPESFARHTSALRGVAAASTTFHSLLKFNPDSGRCRYDANHPLRCEVLIADECSMIDITLWRALLLALTSDARLILIGDPNQLESVGQGDVFGELARVAAKPDSVLHPSHVHLTEARRFRDRPAIITFAEALQNGDSDSAVRLLEAADGQAGLAWMPSTAAVWSYQSLPGKVQQALDCVAFAETPAAAREAMNRICILTAQRQYFVGALAISAAMEEHFFNGTRRAINQPIIINRNDPETGLRNGTLGVIHTDFEGRRLAWCYDSHGKLQSFALARLPDFSPAWAITVHRSQGSEYDEVVVMLPREESPLATRELLYTAITRAKSNVTIVGSLDTVRKAVSTPSGRTTLLAKFL